MLSNAASDKAFICTSGYSSSFDIYNVCSNTYFGRNNFREEKRWKEMSSSDTLTNERAPLSLATHLFRPRVTKAQTDMQDYNNTTAAAANNKFDRLTMEFMTES